MMRKPSNDAQSQRSQWQRQVDSIIETQINRYPFLVQLRAVFRQLEHERESWPLLIPMLVFVFLVVYRRERRKVRELRRDLDNED